MGGLLLLLVLTPPLSSAPLSGGQALHEARQPGFLLLGHAMQVRPEPLPRDLCVTAGGELLCVTTATATATTTTCGCSVNGESHKMAKPPRLRDVGCAANFPRPEKSLSAL